ncbi:16S rRNA pseudouridine516 synthase [Salsuginibacillus halophilus]|uniref:16S rRNA pseudouridine516 synthase n=1 Tax=Salsuginibacillus halophilus TaxID=517424 RepID=A0A2P8HE63_9BACI|nr:pseudouridine synthase [Salsuginibacillus halophilus]PSL44518.1 16S rRNA pseudouridine516 synthase [Salsuginibacillus halophilus]
MRLDKWLAHMGYGTRKEVKQMLKTGEVTVNGEKIKDPGFQVTPDEDEVFAGSEEVVYQSTLYVLMHKPEGVITATKDEEHETVLDLLEIDDVILEPFPVGRLDKDTTGLLLLMTDGKLAHALTSPKKEVAKTYEAELAQPVSENDIQKLEQGIALEDGFITAPAHIEVMNETKNLVHITIIEGKYHQVRRMFGAVSNRVERLKRVAFGPITLDEQDLEPGEYRDLTEEEVEQLVKAVQLNG